MPGQTRIEKPRSHVRARPQEVHEDSRTQRERSRGDAKRAALNEAFDELLEEIDGLLEENAEQFMTDYVQQGGQ